MKQSNVDNLKTYTVIAKVMTTIKVDVSAVNADEAIDRVQNRTIEDLGDDASDISSKMISIKAKKAIE